MRRANGLAITLLLLLAAEAAATAPGTIVVGGTYRREGETTDRGAVMTVDPRSGAATLLSDLADPEQGPVGTVVLDVAIAADGRILALERDQASLGGRGKLLAVDGRTGERTLLSDLADPEQGPTGINPESLAVGPSGVIFVVDSDAGETTDGTVVAIDPRTGLRTLVSDFGNPAQGPVDARDPRGIAVLRDGTLVVLDFRWLLLVDPRTGARTIVSDLEDAAQGPLGVDPYAVAVTSQGAILLVDQDYDSRSDEEGERSSGAVERVASRSGRRTLLSTLSKAAQGIRLDVPTDAAGARSGTIYVLASLATGAGGVFAIDPVTGRRSTVALLDLGDGALGYGFGMAVARDGCVRGPLAGCRERLPRVAR